MAPLFIAAQAQTGGVIAQEIYVHPAMAKHSRKTDHDFNCWLWSRPMRGEHLIKIEHRLAHSHKHNSSDDADEEQAQEKRQGFSFEYWIALISKG